MVCISNSLFPLVTMATKGITSNCNDVLKTKYVNWTQIHCSAATIVADASNPQRRGKLTHRFPSSKFNQGRKKQIL